MDNCFSGLIGNNKLKSTFINAIKDNHVGHAYVFVGQKGIGKKTFSRILSNALLCDHPTEDGACGKCKPCLLFENDSNPDYFIIDNGNDSIGIDEIRQIQTDIFIRPMYSKRKVFVIAESGNMTLQSQNCLLKILEEPPAYATLILTVANIETLIETIQSRVIKHQFERTSKEEIKNVLSSRFNLDKAYLDFLSSYSDGVIGNALEIAESNGFSSLRNMIFELFSKIKNPEQIQTLKKEIFESNKDMIFDSLDVMELLFRDLLLVTFHKENMLINSDKKDIIFENAGKYDVSKLTNIIETIIRTRWNIDHNANYDQSIEMLLLELQEV